MHPYVAVNFDLTLTWDIFTAPINDYWDFDNPPNGKDIKMVMTLKSWLVMIGAFDFDLSEATINDPWY